MKRHFRDKTWSVRVPRRPQELHLRLGNAINDLSQRLHRPPQISELAAELGVREDDVLEAMESAAPTGQPHSTRGPADNGDAMTLESRLGTADLGFDLAEHRVVLRARPRCSARSETEISPVRACFAASSRRRCRGPGPRVE